MAESAAVPLAAQPTATDLYSKCILRTPSPRSIGPSLEGLELGLNHTPAHLGDCGIWLGFKRGPAYQLRAALDGICANQSSAGSRIDCIPIKAKVPHAHQMLLCELTNVQLGRSLSRDGRFHVPPLRGACRWERGNIRIQAAKPWATKKGDADNTTRARRRKSTSVQLADFSPMIIKAGTNNSGCLDYKKYDLCHNELTVGGHKTVGKSIRVDETAERACTDADDRVEHPVVLVDRNDAFNPFHAHEVLWAVWSTYLARGLDPCDTGVLLADGYPDGPLLSLYSTVFAPVHGVQRVSELSQRARHTCFRRIVVAVDHRYHFEVPYTKTDTIKGRCGPSSWLIGFSRFVRSSFGLPLIGVRWTPHVTLVNRVAYRREGGRLVTPKRLLANHEELNMRIESICQGTARIGIGCTRSTNNFAAMPVAKQLERAATTDVLVGVHAAALLFLIYLPPHASIIEFASTTDCHYLNLASYMGLTHVRLRGPGHFTEQYRVDLMEAERAVQTEVRRAAEYLSGRRPGSQGLRLEEPPRPATWPREVPWEVPAELLLSPPPPPAPPFVPPAPLTTLLRGAGARRAAQGRGVGRGLSPIQQAKALQQQRARLASLQTAPLGRAAAAKTGRGQGLSGPVGMATRGRAGVAAGRGSFGTRGRASGRVRGQGRASTGLQGAPTAAGTTREPERATPPPFAD